MEEEKQSFDSIVLQVQFHKEKSKYVHNILTSKIPKKKEEEEEEEEREDDTIITFNLFTIDKCSFLLLEEFVNSGDYSLTSDQPQDLLDLIRVADMMMVETCVEDAVGRLVSKYLPIEVALECMDKSPYLYMDDLQVHALSSLVKKFSAIRQVLPAFSQTAMENLLRSDDLNINCECEIYDLANEWATQKYGDLDERNGVMDDLLLRNLIRVSHLSCDRLRQVAPELVRKAVSRKLLGQIPPRKYKWISIRSINFHFPHEESIIYCDLTRESIGQLYPGGPPIRSQLFLAARRRFMIEVRLHEDEDAHKFIGLYLTLLSEVPEGILARFEFSALRREDTEYSVLGSFIGQFNTGIGIGFHNPFGVSWVVFIDEDFM